MIGTHSVKTLDASLQQKAVCADIIAPVPVDFICSQTIRAEKKYFAMPQSAATYRTDKADAAQANEADTAEPFLPDFTDPRISQVLLPYREDYVAAAPVLSSSMLHSVDKRTQNWHRFFDWTIQPIGAARANHGEVIVTQDGKLRLLRVFCPPARTSTVIPDDIVCVKFRLVNANVSNGFLSVGFPSITSVGGLVHSIERNFGAVINFAVGFQNTGYSVSAVMTHKVSGLRNVKVSPSFKTSEIKGYADVVLLLKTGKKGLREYMKANVTHRLSGGDVFDYQVLQPAEHEIFTAFLTAGTNGRFRADGEGDVLDHAIKNIEIFTHNGYGFLEYPVPGRKYARKGYPAAWVEPLFRTVTLKNEFSLAVFWRRYETDAGVYWNAM